MERTVHFCTFNEADEYDVPEGFAISELTDDFGIYITGPDGAAALAAVNADDERSSYRIREGARIILKDAFSGNPMLTGLFIPASVQFIEDGALSNSGGWADDDNGIREVTVDPANEKYFTEDGFVYERCQDGTLKIILYFGKSMTPVIKKEVSAIGEKAFYGSFLKSAALEGPGVLICFPNQPFHNRELAGNFGKNGKLYDFTDYDAFLMRNHYSPDRLRMICGRIRSGYDIDDARIKAFSDHIYEHMDWVYEQLIKHDALEELRELTETKIINKENIDEAIEAFNDAGSTQLLKFLMDHKNERFGQEEFDFSI